MFTIHLINTDDPRRRLTMKYTRLTSHQSLITEPSDELLILASFLEIPADDVDLEDDHIFIIDKVGALSLGSFIVRRESDVLISNKTYSELLIDISSGMTVLEAYNKHGYTFGY